MIGGKTNSRVLGLKIISIITTVVSISDTIFFLLDKESDYVGLPTFPIYIMLFAFILITIYTLCVIETLKENMREKELIVIEN